MKGSIRKSHKALVSPSLSLLCMSLSPSSIYLQETVKMKWLFLCVCMSESKQFYAWEAKKSPQSGEERKPIYTHTHTPLLISLKSYKHTSLSLNPFPWAREKKEKEKGRRGRRASHWLCLLPWPTVEPRGTQHKYVFHHTSLIETHVVNVLHTWSISWLFWRQ